MTRPKDSAERGIVPTPAPEASNDRQVVALHRGRLIPLPGTPLAACPTSLDLSSERGMALAINVGNPADIVMDEHGCARILCTDWLVYPEEKVDETSGELKQYVVTCFIDKAGRTLKTTSPYAAHRLAEMVGFYPRARWARGIPIVIVERRSRREKRTYHDVRVEMEPGYE
jgi:hypothetical protein